ncbi:MAG: hypothetical protein KIT84_07955 [Labilithrix sp.]|nr:hypothetical protein [Labilithrix sp.]MCW5810931.1 hypothetical protein [Labilithrix sp.]
MRRGVFALLAVAGCLFPSFDGLKGSGAGDDDDDDGGAKTSASSSSSSTSSSSTSSSSSSSSGDSGSTPDTGAPKVRCGGALDCDVATTFCCAKITGPNECRARGSGTGGCNSVLDCDGPEDCTSGQSCCQNMFGGSNAVCKAGGCGNGYTFCHPGVPNTCPPSEPSCSGDHIGIHGAEPVSCE